MASVDLRIRRSARRSRERWALHNETEFKDFESSERQRKLLERQDLEELRELLNDEIYNMQERFRAALAIRGSVTPEQQRIFVKRLHMLSFDGTYRDFGPTVKYPRTRARIDALIDLCHGDEVLFLREYVRALEKFFPVKTWSSRYVWNPRLLVKTLKSGKARKTIKHHMSYRYRPERPLLELVEL